MMEGNKLCRFVLLLAVLSHGVWARRPFKSHQSPRETIKNYEVFTPVIQYGDHRETSLDVSIITKTYNFTIRLTMNKQLLSPRFMSKHYDSHSNEVLTKGHPNCFYHGEVEGHPTWTATISTCSGIRGSFGDLATKTSLYNVEPLGDNKNISLDQPHVIFMETEYQNRTRTCGTSHNHTVRPEAIGRELHHLTERLRRQATGQSGTLYVELAIINDLAQYQKYGSDLQTTVNRAIEITNGADSLYKASFGIRIVLVQVITWSNGNMITVAPDSSTTLGNLQVYAPAVTIQHDVTMLLTGISLNSNVVGLAYVSGMCSSYSVNLVQDFGSLPAVSSTTAHEIGHLFSMNHDTASCTCTQSTGCIMAAVQGSVAPNQWSSCSAQTITTALSTTNLGSCLTNVPQTIVGTPTCGNGIREGNEICDCGTLQGCTDPCCNASTCQLAAGAQCDGGACCSNCRFVSYGTQCRASRGECDIAEVCSGCSSQCPGDQYVQDGTLCGSGTGYCYGGACPTRDNQCKAFYGSSGRDGDSSCYTNYNTRGDLHGNCGPKGVSTYTACSASNVYCGSLQCANTGTQFPTISIVGSTQLGTHGTTTATCKSFLVTPSDGSITNIWLVQNGTKCGSSQVCISSQCLALSNLNTRPCPVGSNGLVCSGNGVCANGGNCSCKVGFTGSACSAIYTSSVCAVPKSSIIAPTSSKIISTLAVTSLKQTSTGLPVSARLTSTPVPVIVTSIKQTSAYIAPPASITLTPAIILPLPTKLMSTPAPVVTSAKQTFTNISPSATSTSTPSLRQTSTILPLPTKLMSTPVRVVTSAKQTSTNISPSATSTSTPSLRQTSTILPLPTKLMSTPVRVVTSAKQTSTNISPSATSTSTPSLRQTSTILPLPTKLMSTPVSVVTSAKQISTNISPSATSTSTPSLRQTSTILPLSTKLISTPGPVVTSSSRQMSTPIRVISSPASVNTSSKLLLSLPPTLTSSPPIGTSRAASVNPAKTSSIPVFTTSNKLPSPTVVVRG